MAPSYSKQPNTTVSRALFRSVEPRGEYRGWVKVKTNAWRAANQERWRLFERTH
jgi:hypothetical protein